MSEHDRDAERRAVLRKPARGVDPPRSDRPRKDERGVISAFTALARRVGNAAAGRLFATRGRPIGEQSDSKLRTAFGAQIQGARVVDDPASHAAARALDATAFTTGDTVYLGDRAPPMSSPAGEALLAHELAHVVQQHQATQVNTGDVSRPGDVFERSADAAAQSVSRGESATVSASGAPPGVQRQMADPSLAYRAQVERAIHAYLQRALVAQGGQALRRTDAVHSALRMLAQADDPRWRGRGPDPKKVTRVTAIESLVAGPMFRGKPSELAKVVAGLLPDPFDPATLERLRQMPAGEQAPKGGAGLMGLVERTSPVAPNFPEEPAPKTMETITPQGQRMDALARDEHMVNAPVSQLIDIAKGMKGAVKGEKAKPRVAPSSPSAAPEFAAHDPTRRFASQPRGLLPEPNQITVDLMRLTNEAHDKKRSSVSLRLDASFAGAKDQAAIFAELERIVGLVVPAVPKGTTVREVRVYFGDQLVKVIRFAEAPAKKEKGRDRNWFPSI